jgi:hypothetical protein
LAFRTVFQHYWPQVGIHADNRGSRPVGRWQTKGECLMYNRLMGQKTCTVSFREPDGTIHTVDVTASTVYEAAVRAIRAFRDEEWSMSPVFRAGVLEIFVKQPVVKHVALVQTPICR